MKQTHFTDIVNGTGPFKLETWTKGQEIIMVRNDDYWRTEPAWEGGPTGPAKLQRVVIKIVREWHAPRHAAGWRCRLC